MMWIIWMFIPYLAWVGWLYAGIRTNQNRYFKLAMIYAVPLLLRAVSATEISEDSLNTIATAVWIAGIVHVLKLKNTVNLQIKNAPEPRSDPIQVIKTNIMTWIDGIFSKLKDRYSLEIKNVRRVRSDVNPAKQTNWKPEDDVRVFSPSSKTKVTPRKDTTFRRFCRLFDRTPRRVPKRSADPTNASETFSASLEKVDLTLEEVDVNALGPVNINSATEEEIASLPGIGPLLAKKAVQYRETERLFHSAEDFASVLKLTPHILGLLRTVLVVDQTEASTPKKQPAGRVVDY
jgi:DNA uptake protein ComE-like DNA-binding protein